MPWSTVKKGARIAVSDPARLARSLRYRARKRFNPLDEIAGEVAFGNKTRLTRNIAGRREVKSARNESAVPSETPNLIAEEMRDHGLYEVGNPYSENTIRDIRKRYQDLIKDESRSVPMREIDGENYLRMIPLPHRLIPEIQDLLTEEIRSLIRAYYGSHFQVKYVKCWRNYHVPPEVRDSEGTVLGDHWHSDPRPTSWFKLFVNLSDVTEDSGPLHLLPISETKSLVRRRLGRSDEPGDLREILKDSSEVVRATGPPGTAFLTNTQHCLHRAGIPEPGETRDIVQFQFLPSTEPLPEDWPSHVETAKPGKRWLEDHEAPQPHLDCSM